jgi:yecA family protein
MGPTRDDDAIDEILRGDGRGGHVGLSAVDGLIAAVVAGPATLPTTDWLPLVFGGRMPHAAPGTPAQRMVEAILARHAEVRTLLETAPDDYRPLFMADEGRVIVEDWTVGFVTGIGLARAAWEPILLSRLRTILRPILAANEAGRTLLPDLSWAKQERLRRNAHLHIADAVVELHRCCHAMPHGAEARGPASTRPPSAKRVRS